MSKNPTRQAAALYDRIIGVASPWSETRPEKAPSRIMYIERKAGNLVGLARIGRVTFSKTWKSIYYQGQAFQRIPGGGFKANYFEKETKEEYWISGPKKDGSDRLYGERIPIEIDEDVRDEYWCLVRNQPERKQEPVA